MDLGCVEAFFEEVLWFCPYHKRQCLCSFWRQKKKINYRNILRFASLSIDNFQFGGSYCMIARSHRVKTLARTHARPQASLVVMSMMCRSAHKSEKGGGNEILGEKEWNTTGTIHHYDGAWRWVCACMLVRVLGVGWDLRVTTAAVGDHSSLKSGANFGFTCISDLELICHLLVTFRHKEKRTNNAQESGFRLQCGRLGFDPGGRPPFASRNLCNKLFDRL